MSDKQKVIVIAATRKDGCVGYFKTLNDVPPEFTHPGEENIAGVMAAMRTSDLDVCLRSMNSHWQKKL